MNDFFSAVLRIMFATLLGMAAIITTVILSPFLLILWLLKNLTNNPPK